MPEPKAGDWVNVKALVTNPDPHPDEYSVRFESHNEHYVGVVRRDMCELTAPPEWAPRCMSLVADTDVEEALFRCTGKHEHSGKHRNGHRKWDDRDCYGYVEDAS